MKRAVFGLGAFVLLFSILAWGTPLPAIDQAGRWVKGGLWIGLQPATSNKETRSLGNSAVIDFPAVTIACSDSAGITVTGALAGDPCFVGAPAAPAANSSFTCYVSAANTVLVRHCPAGSLVDPASATYLIRLISSQ